MESKHYTDRLSIAGLAVGFLAFILYGMLYGALIGGAAGQEAGIGIFGYGVSSRAMSAAGMVVGILVSGAVFLSTGFAAGKAASILLCHSRKENGTTAAIRH